MSLRLHFALPVLLLLAAACSGGPGPSDPTSPSGRAGPPGGESTAPAESASAPPSESSARGDGGMPSYRGAQADRGRAVFRDRCAECHYTSEMQGAAFQSQWRRRTVADLYEHLVGTMPEDDPGSLTPTEYLEVVAYILSLNGFPEGAAELERGGGSFQTLLAAPSGSR